MDRRAHGHFLTSRVTTGDTKSLIYQLQQFFCHRCPLYGLFHVGNTATITRRNTHMAEERPKNIHTTVASLLSQIQAMIHWVHSVFFDRSASPPMPQSFGSLPGECLLLQPSFQPITVLWHDHADGCQVLATEKEAGFRCIEASVVVNRKLRKLFFSRSLQRKIIHYHTRLCQ